MKLGIMCATERELNPLVNKLENHQTENYICRTFHTGTLEGIDTVAIIGGVGKVNGSITAQALIEHYKIDKLIFTGVAGGLDDSLKVRDVIIATEIAYHDIPMDLVNNENMFDGMPEKHFVPDSELIEICRHLDSDLRFGTIITGDEFISGARKHELMERFHPLCVDMESAAVAHVCWFYNTPLLVIRSLSDTAEDDAMDTYEANAASSGLSAIAVVLKVVEKLSK